MHWLLLLACHGSGSDSAPVIDADDDGFAPPEDCDDANEAIHPDAVETCNAIDDDCNGSVDDEPIDGLPFYRDADSDGFGADDDDDELVACDQPDGYEWNAQDCDDARDDVYPGAVETCDDTDQDCDGKKDDACS